MQVFDKLCCSLGQDILNSMATWGAPAGSTLLRFTCFIRALYVSIRQRTPAYASRRYFTPLYVLYTSAYVSIRQHTPAGATLLRFTCFSQPTCFTQPQLTATWGAPAGAVKLLYLLYCSYFTRISLLCTALLALLSLLRYGARASRLCCAALVLGVLLGCDCDGLYVYACLHIACAGLPLSSLPPLSLYSLLHSIRLRMPTYCLSRS